MNNVTTVANFFQLGLQNFQLTTNLACALICVAVAIAVSLAIKPSRKTTLTACLAHCKESIEIILRSNDCHPLFLRLAWSDACSYDRTIRHWPKCGGCNGSIRFEKELEYTCNAGLAKAILLLTPLKETYPAISWADLIQLAGATAVSCAGGPDIDMIYGRIDACESDIETKESILPGATFPFPDGSPSPDVHLRNFFYRLGFNNRELVALYGAHTLGRAFADRSGVCPNSSGEQGATKYTKHNAIVKNGDGGTNNGIPGGKSWTRNWLVFDNSYFKRELEARDPDLLYLPTDRALAESPEFKSYFIEYAHNQELFFQNYALAHKKMSELGARFHTNHVVSLKNCALSNN